jgi:hypothetical protein
MTDKYWFSSGGFIDIQGISINPNTSARVQALCFYPGNNIQMKFVDITGDEYAAWSQDDNYIIGLVGHKLGLGTRVNPIDLIADPDRTEVTPFEYQYQAPATLASAQTTTDDNRSVHNEADVQRIQTLQEQLDEQKKKLEQITSLLFKNGAI